MKTPNPHRAMSKTKKPSRARSTELSPAAGVRTGLSVADLKQAFLDNLFCALGRVPTAAWSGHACTASSSATRRASSTSARRARSSSRNTPSSSPAATSCSARLDNSRRCAPRCKNSAADLGACAWSIRESTGKPESLSYKSVCNQFRFCCANHSVTVRHLPFAELLSAIGDWRLAIRSPAASPKGISPDASS